MAPGDFTLAKQKQIPQGTTVDVFAYRADLGDVFPKAGIRGAPAASQAMTANGAAFTGLTPGGRYFAHAGGRVVRFTASLT
jgi:hypothetical protein